MGSSGIHQSLVNLSHGSSPIQKEPGEDVNHGNQAETPRSAPVNELICEAGRVVYRYNDCNPDTESRLRL